MKVALTSDVHLEFGPLELHNEQGADVLILSGDILVEKDLDFKDDTASEMGFARQRSESWHKFFDEVCERFPHVIYIAGNHEHYHGDYANTIPNLKNKLAHHVNLHILDKETFNKISSFFPWLTSCLTSNSKIFSVLLKSTIVVHLTEN